MRRERYIVHVDMDAFFAAIEERDNPKLCGRPIVVGADPKAGRGRGVVSTCSYEARRFGIRSAMPISVAYRKCPGAVFLPVDMEKYSRVSQKIYKILYEFTPNVEPISIDEAFLDITGVYHLFGTARTSCLLIKERIKEETALTASIGLAPTKMAAKIASDLQKPDGFVEVRENELLNFLHPLDISKIWGLGKKSEAVLRGMGINTIGELAQMDVRELVRVFGKNGLHFWNLANGIDERTVETESRAESISSEVTFAEDTLDRRKIEGTLMRLCERASGRLRQDGLKGRTLTLKVRLQDFKTHTRSVTLDRPTNFSDILYKELEKLYNMLDTKGKKVRLVGVAVSKLSSAGMHQMLFAETADERRERIHRAVDKIKKRFGDEAINRATSI